MSYTSLHNHTHYSNLRMIDSINTEETLIDRAFELGLKGVAITDHESVSGHVKALNYFNKKYKDKPDFKLILGNEIYLTRSGLNSETHEKGEKFYHLLLLAKDATGHRQLRELSTRAWSRAYYKNMMRTPTFMEDLIEVIKSDPGHVIATTACLASFTGTMFMMNELDAIEPHLKSMVNIFGKENFFIEIQPSDSQDQIDYNKHLIINFWDEYDFIFTTDSHYLKKEDREIHKLFLQSKSSNRDVDSYYGSAYVMSWEELLTYFNRYIGMPKLEIMRQNTNKIRDMIEAYDLDHGQIVPQIKYGHDFNQSNLDTIRNLFVENGLDEFEFLKLFMETDQVADKYLMDLILEGYYKLIYDLDHQPDVKVSVRDRMKRLDYEIEQIHKTSIQIEQSLSDYFITMAKMIEIIWNEADSMVGPGRGSAAGFLVNYLIGITQIDPMTQMLYLPPWRLTEKVTHTAGYKSCIGLLCMATYSK